MRTLREIDDEIALLREELNLAVRDEMKTHVPTHRLLEISGKMDELLNERQRMHCYVE